MSREKRIHPFGENPDLHSKIEVFLARNPTVTPCYLPNNIAQTGGDLKKPVKGYGVHAYFPVPTIFLEKIVTIPVTKLEFDCEMEGGKLNKKIVRIPLIVYRYQTGNSFSFVAFLRGK